MSLVNPDRERFSLTMFVPSRVKKFRKAGPGPDSC